MRKVNDLERKKKERRKDRKRNSTKLSCGYVLPVMPKARGGTLPGQITISRFQLGEIVYHSSESE